MTYRTLLSSLFLCLLELLTQGVVRGNLLLKVLLKASANKLTEYKTSGHVREMWEELSCR